MRCIFCRRNIRPHTSFSKGSHPPQLIMTRFCWQNQCSWIGIAELIVILVARCFKLMSPCNQTHSKSCQAFGQFTILVTTGAEYCPPTVLRISISDKSNLIVEFNSFELHHHHHRSSEILSMALPTTMPFPSKMIWCSVFSCILGVSGDMFFMKHAFFNATHLLQIYTNHLWYN